jgi:phytoene synthase
VPLVPEKAAGLTALEASWLHCRRVAHTRARNFYYAFRLLDEPRRNAICSVYAFMRRCDDLSDEPGASLEALERWRGQLNAALQGQWGPDPLWPAFHETVRRYCIPHQYFHDMIDGVASDLSRTTMEDFEELYRYCYQVASVAGLSLMHVFGATSGPALLAAERCGVAFQLTNILRDVAEDAARGRTYLPRQDMARFGLERMEENEPFLELMRFEAARARAYYQEARDLPSLVDPSCAASLWALIEIYSRLLGKIEQAGYRVLSRRIRLSAFEKTWISWRALWRWRWSSS